MIVEISKQYQTRDGRKVRILCTDKKGEYPVVGIITDEEGDEREDSWTENGGYEYGSVCEGRLDLIPVPEKRSGWINIYDESTLHETKKYADAMSGPAKRVACVEVSYTVGEGL